MSSASLAQAVDSAKAASEQAWQALVGLAEALGTPGAAAAAVVEAETVLVEAEEVAARLEGALVQTIRGAAATPTPGLDAEGLYRALGVAADASASELERELSRNRQRHRHLWVIRTIALVLMLPCALLLSLDVVREAVGVTQESHLVSCLATVTLVCQMALWGVGTSKRHLATAASHQRQQALRYRRLAREAAAATAATAAANEATTAAHVTLSELEEVTGQLRTVVDAVTQDLEMAQGFPASARALGDAVVALGTAMGDKEGTQRLAQVLESLPGDE